MSRRVVSEKTLARARDMRKNPTKSEALLWTILRRKQFGNIRFRRQHPVEPWILDFACLQHMLAIEIDGNYHDSVVEKDLMRQRDLLDRGWRVVRFTAKDVEEDPEAIGNAIAKLLGIGYEPVARKGPCLMPRLKNEIR